VEDSQRRIVEAVRRLDESGEVHISRGEGEQIVE
jgi:flagellar motor switch protein FliG